MLRLACRLFIQVGVGHASLTHQDVGLAVLLDTVLLQADHLLNQPLLVLFRNTLLESETDCETERFEFSTTASVVGAVQGRNSPM